MEKNTTKIHVLIRKAVMSVFQFCLHGLSPGDCTMAIEPLVDSHRALDHHETLERNICKKHLGEKSAKTTTIYRIT